MFFPLQERRTAGRFSSNQENLGRGFHGRDGLHARRGGVGIVGGVGGRGGTVDPYDMGRPGLDGDADRRHRRHGRRRFPRRGRGLLVVLRAEERPVPRGARARRGPTSTSCATSLLTQEF